MNDGSISGMNFDDYQVYWDLLCYLGIQSCAMYTCLYASMSRWRHQKETFSELLALWGESTGDRWIPLTKASDAELWCFLWSAPEQTVDQTIETPVIWDAIHYGVTVIVLTKHERWKGNEMN